MHYKNGREAKNGDKVVMVQNGKMYVGVLYDAVAGNDHCNGALAPLSQTTYCYLKECLHMDDAVAAFPVDVPNSSVPVAVNPPAPIQAPNQDAATALESTPQPTVGPAPAATPAVAAESAPVPACPKCARAGCMICDKPAA
jgi:hypothetical protein